MLVRRWWCGLTWTSCTLASDSLSESSSDEEDSEEEEAAPPPAEKNRDMRPEPRRRKWTPPRCADRAAEVDGCKLKEPASGAPVKDWVRLYVVNYSVSARFR